MDAYVNADIPGRCQLVFKICSWLQRFLVTLLLSLGVCVGAMCVLFVWLVEVSMLCVCYGVGVVSLGAWRVLEGRVMWSLYVICVMFVFICACCLVDCPHIVFCIVCGKMVVVCLCVCGIVVCIVGLCSMCLRVLTCGGVFVRRAACCGRGC